MMDLVCHLEQMYSMWDYELNEAIKKDDTGNIMYCKAKYETYHNLLMDIKNGKFFNQIREE